MVSNVPERWKKANALTVELDTIEVCREVAGSDIVETKIVGDEDVGNDATVPDVGPVAAASTA